MGRGGEIFVLDMGEPVRIVDLAADLIGLSGFQVGEDIEIEFTGIRPGEKLYEELNADGESHAATSHPKIMVAECASRDLATISRTIDRLERLANSGPGPLRAVLEEIVPEYRDPSVDLLPLRRAA